MKPESARLDTPLRFHRIRVCVVRSYIMCFFLFAHPRYLCLLAFPAVLKHTDNEACVINAGIFTSRHIVLLLFVVVFVSVFLFYFIFCC